MATAQAKPQQAATPWGAAGVVEEVTVPQRVGDKRFSVVVQLLETRSGERLVRAPTRDREHRVGEGDEAQAVGDDRQDRPAVALPAAPLD